MQHEKWNRTHRHLTTLLRDGLALLAALDDVPADKVQAQANEGRALNRIDDNMCSPGLDVPGSIIVAEALGADGVPGGPRSTNIGSGSVPQGQREEDAHEDQRVRDDLFAAAANVTAHDG